MPKRTALFEEHQKLGGRLIDFGGWELPVQYTGVMEEHLGAARQVLFHDASILNRQFPPAKIDQAAPELLMLLKKSGPFRHTPALHPLRAPCPASSGRALHSPE